MRTGILALVMTLAALSIGVAVERDHRACTVRGRCLEVESGDTVILEIPEGRVRLRLAGIRAPVDGQATFEASRVRLVEAVYLRELCVRPTAATADGTLIGVVTVDGADLAHRQLEHGFAWFDATTDPGDGLAVLEGSARERRAGLWSRGEPESPWTYEERLARAAEAAQPTPTPSLVELAGRTRFANPANRRIVMVSTPTPTATPEDGEGTVTLSLSELLEALDAASSGPSPTPTPH